VTIQYQSNIDAVIRALTEARERTLEAIGLYVEGEAKLRCPYDRGNLRGSIDHKVETDKKMVIIGTNVEYAVYMEKGTGIYAKDGKGRQTPWRYKNAHGKWVMTRGNKAQPYLTPAVEENISNITRLAEQIYSQI
jgi:hypothetical protein